MIESELTPEEYGAAQEFYQRLREPDLRNVQGVLNAVDGVAKNYFQSGETRENDWAFEGTRPGKTGNYRGTPFFAVYLVGGQLTKKGERKDIDLLTVTNMRWTSGFLNDERRFPGRSDPMWLALVAQFKEDGRVKRRGKLPTDYNLGYTRGKVLMNIHPSDGKRIDCCYVRSWPFPDYRFIDEADFIERDRDKRGQPLQRFPLYRSTSALGPSDLGITIFEL